MQNEWRWREVEMVVEGGLHVGLDSSSMKFDNWYAVSMLLRETERGARIRERRGGWMLWSRAPDEMGYLSFSNCNTL